ncbi:BlaI/MecI/CopY family transcriptional regulator [Aliikangiella sp. IMCC44653]
MKISNSEKNIMDVLWQTAPLNAKSIIQRLDSNLDWEAKTAKTLINRLLKKEAIGFEKNGREYLYYPIIQKQEYVEQASESFLKKVFDGSVSSLVAAFAKQEKLTADDIQALRDVLNQVENKEDK